MLMPENERVVKDAINADGDRFYEIKVLRMFGEQLSGEVLAK